MRKFLFFTALATALGVGAVWVLDPELLEQIIQYVLDFIDNLKSEHGDNF